MAKKEFKAELLGQSWNCSIGKFIICEDNYDLLLKVKADVFVEEQVELKIKSKKK